MNSNLWNDTQTESSSTDTTATATTAPSTTSGEHSPLDAAIEASSWTREDVELVLQAAQVLLLAFWAYHTYHE